MNTHFRVTPLEIAKAQIVVQEPTHLLDIAKGIVGGILRGYERRELTQSNPIVISSSSPTVTGMPDR